MKNRRIVAVILTIGLSAVTSIPALAGQWKQDSAGWWWQNDDGSYPVSTWQWIDENKDGLSESYYFNEAGYLVTNTTIDGYIVNEDGAWVVNGIVQTKNGSVSSNYSYGQYEINPVLFEEMNSTVGQLIDKYGDFGHLGWRDVDSPFSSSDKMKLNFQNAEFDEYESYTKIEKGQYFPQYDHDGDGRHKKWEISYSDVPTIDEWKRITNLSADKYVLDREKMPYSIKGKILVGFTNESYPVEEVGRYIKNMGAKNMEVINKNSRYEKTETVLIGNTFYSRPSGEYGTSNITKISFELGGLKFNATGENGMIYPQKTVWTVTR